VESFLLIPFIYWWLLPKSLYGDVFLVMYLTPLLERYLISCCKLNLMGRVKHLYLNTLLSYRKFACPIILLMKLLYAGCSLLLLHVELKASARLFQQPLFTHGRSLWVICFHVFENYNYDELCEEILEIRKKKNEEAYASSHHFVPLCFLSGDKETYCVVNLSSDFFAADTEEGFYADNETLQVIPMVM